MKEFLDQEGRSVDWTSIKAVIFDVDGTLYHQKPVRIHIACRLLVYFLIHPLEIKDLLGIWHFRKLRETESFRTRSFEEQVQGAAQRAGISDEARLNKAIQKWMFQEPLSLIQKNGNQAVLTLLKQLQSEGKRILIYSDYAPEEKLSALGVVPDAVYYPGHNGIEELKPSGKSVQRILKDQFLSASDAVYLGDRAEKDGESARAAGMCFVLVNKK